MPLYSQTNNLIVKNICQKNNLISSIPIYFKYIQYLSMILNVFIDSKGIVNNNLDKLFGYQISMFYLIFTLK